MRLLGRLDRFALSCCLAVAGCGLLTGSALGSTELQDAAAQPPVGPMGKSAPTFDLGALADATGSFVDAADDVNIDGNNFYVSPDILVSDVFFTDNDVGRIDDDTFQVFTLIDSRPLAGVTSQLFDGDTLTWWLNTDNNAATGGVISGIPMGADAGVLLKGVANGTPGTAIYAVWNASAGKFGDDIQITAAQINTKFGWSVPAPAVGILRGRPVGVLVRSGNTLASALRDEDFSPQGLPLFSFAVPGPPPAPIVANGEATSVSAAGLTVNGTITPGGSQTTWFVRYGVGSVNEARTPDQSAGQGTAATGVSATLSGLRPSTAYQYQVVAMNPWGETAGPIASASTALPAIQSLPVATTQARGVQTDRLTLTGTVDPQGRKLSAYFEWGKSKKYDKRTPKVEVAAGKFGLTSITSLVRNLAPNSRLHYRLVIEGDDGATSAGQDLTVETAVPDRLVIVGDPDGSCRDGCVLKKFSIEVRLRDGDTNKVRSAGKLRGVTARVRCTSVCSVNTRFMLKKGRVLRAEIGRLFGGRSLASGATIEVRITGPGLTGALYRARFVNDNLIQRTCELRGSRAAACARV
jgi:hypothetical protein